MPRDRAERDLDSAAYFGLPPETIGVAARIDVREIEPPRDQLGERGLRGALIGLLCPSPIRAMPTLPVLKPSACAPPTLRVMPP